MEDLFELIYENIVYVILIFLFICLLSFLSNLALLENITSRITREAEISGVITSAFVNETYNKSPLSKIKGDFKILDIKPGLNTKAEYLGDVMSITVSKDFHITDNFYITLKSTSVAINQGLYGKGYR